MALPLLRLLSKSHDPLTIITPGQYADLFSGLSGARLAPFPDQLRHGLRGAFALADLIRSLNLHRAFILPGSFSSALSFWLARVPERVGFASDGRLVLLTEPHALKTSGEGQHRSQLYLSLLSGEEQSTARDRMISLASLRAVVAPDQLQRFSAFGWTAAQRYAVLPFLAVAESRRWGRENYAALARWLVESEHLQVYLVGTNADRAEGEWLAQRCGAGVRNLAGETTIAELMHLLSGATIVIGNDSGTCHLAAAVGAPLVVLSGADDPRETSPLSGQKIVLQARQVDCLGCVKNRCPKSGNQFMRCMRELSIADVQRAVTELLTRSNDINRQGEQN